MRGSAGGACTARGGAACGPAYNESHAFQRPGNRLPPLRDRPRATARHRRARDGSLGRGPRERRGRRDGLADDSRLPDPQPLPDGRRPGGARARRRDRRQRQLRRPLRQREGVARPQARPRLAARGSAGAGGQRDLRRLGQGRRRQVERDRQPRRGAGRRRASAWACSTPMCGATHSRGCSAWAPSARGSTASARSSR